MSGNLSEKRMPLFPITTAVQPDRAGETTLHIGGLSVAALAGEFGTPLYIYDQATLEASLADYRQALARFYPGPANLTFAGKAFLNLAMAQWVGRHGLILDCTGAGEIHVAQRAGLPRQQILVHGVSKSRDDLQAALNWAGTIVVDNLAELKTLLAMPRPDPALPEIWLRLRPGIAVQTDHHHTQTGQEDSKFGMSFGEGLEAVRLCQSAGAPLTGLHFHQGSHFHNPEPVAPALESVLEWVVEARSTSGWTPQTICPGGGWGVPYHEDDLPHHPLEGYVELIGHTMSRTCAQNRLALPALRLEPGRSIVARAGVAVYRVNAVKNTAHRRWLLLDGGMADNPRVALYGAHYSALPVHNPQRPAAGPAWLAGPYCESGDILIENLAMPEIEPGELVAVPVSGAYHLAMGSNYNGARKPAVVWLTGGKAHLIQERETLESLTARDHFLPEDL